MIIPVKCFTCGKVLADKYRYYLTEVHKIKLNDNPVNLPNILDQKNNPDYDEIILNFKN